MWTVYILRCRDGSLYTGVATDVARRLKEHRAGKGSRYVRSKLPARLVHQECCHSRSAALKREARIKSLNHREKNALIVIRRRSQ